jgi:hypothetical protein
MTVRSKRISGREALVFIAALSHPMRDGSDDDIEALEADELMDEMDVSDELRALVVADVVGGQYQCDVCFPDGCGDRAEEHNATGREVGLPLGSQLNGEWAGFVPKKTHARDVWDQPVSRIQIIHEIAEASVPALAKANR